MLVKFAIDPDAIDDLTNSAHTDRLLKAWEHYGLLVYPCDTDILREKISKLSNQTAKTLWQTTWKKVRKYPRAYRRRSSCEDFAIDWEKMLDDSFVLAAHNDNFEVALLSGFYAEYLGICDGGSMPFVCNCCKNEVEGVRLSDVDQSKVFKESEHLSKETILINKPVEDLWQERFHQFAEHSKDVVIVDQYAVSDSTIEGLFRLLGLLARSATGCDVTIYSAVPEEHAREEKLRSREEKLRSREEKLRSIEEKLTDESDRLRCEDHLGIKSIQIRLFCAHRFSTYAHDRHLRFDNNVFHIGRGIRVFKFENVQEATYVVQVPLEPGKPEQKEKYLGKLKAIREFYFQLI